MPDLQFAISHAQFKVSLIIDGYNLIYAAGIVSGSDGPANLERSRAALLGFLAESVEPKQLPRTTVVFDAGPHAPRGLPRTWTYRKMTIRFATGYESADDLIEELIQTDTAPRQLILVSSDHRLQRAARRRRATSVDSDRWYQETIRNRRFRHHADDDDTAKPVTRPSEGEVARWVEQFATDEPSLREPSFDNPFPPGYAEDVTDQ
ncbi:MAG: NYN domain-containing protein [Planctomycetota bacterium]|nr:NYN domain-containing protein [Planctomycetota bacterium]